MWCLTCQPGAPLDPCLLHSAPYLAPSPCFPTSLEPSSSSPWQPYVVAAAAHTALQNFQCHACSSSALALMAEKGRWYWDSHGVAKDKTAAFSQDYEDA